MREPDGRLTRIAGRLSDALDADPEFGREHDRAILMIMDEHGGGIGIHAYKDDTEAMVDLLMHLRAMFEANGKTILILPMAGGGVN
jgi:hypothetical protein